MIRAALSKLLNPQGEDYETYFPYLPESIGITGLHPYHDFSNKPILTVEESQELIQYWAKTLDEAKSKLTRRYGNGEIASFTDRYPTTHYAFHCLYANASSDPSLSLVVNNLLLKLDSLPLSVFNPTAELPWWKDPQWEE